MFRTTIKAGACVLALLCHSPGNAIPIAEVPDGSSNTILQVSYTQGVINSGPLSFGLGSLPDEVNARFRLGKVSADPQNPLTLNYGIADVMSAGVSFGDALWSTLASFELEVENGVVESLSYEFMPVFSATHTGGIVLNFPLDITGTDNATGEDFSYTYAESSQTFRNVPLPASVALFGIGLAGLGWSRHKASTVSG